MSFVGDGQEATTTQASSPNSGSYRFSVDSLPAIFRPVFSSNFEYFNEIQTKLFDLLIHEDKSLVTSYANINIILATPEKFDHVIRTDPRSRGLLQVLKLILIDEVHMLSDQQRGDVLEATITRIKALRSKHSFLSPRASEYRFDIQLSYKVEAIIRAHSDSKPVIVFSSTRKSVEFTAKILAASNETYFFSDSHRDEYFNEVSKLINANFDISSGFIYDNENYFKNVDLKTCLASGVGFYHSGMDLAERRLLEKLFAKSLIPVLVSTSSLAMGVNLPAHMVIIKNTVQYLAGKTIEYDSAQVLQMIGRAGRPQFDVTAKAVIMTETSKKNFYDTLLNSDKAIESVLPLTLIEQLMIEIVLRTVTSIETTVDWICSTFMYIRIVSNPSYYGSSIAKGDIEGSLPFIFNWSHENINKLANLSLINMKPESNSFEPTHLARIVTRYGISIKSTELLLKMLKEEKKFLNEYSKNLRFKSKDKIKNSSMKINCLLQATFESIQIDSTLTQDSSNLVRRGQRITKCFVETKFTYVNDSPQSKTSLAESPEFEALFEMSSQMTKGNKKQKISIPKSTPKKTKIDPSNVAQIKREDTSEFLNFVNEMTTAQNEEFVNLSKTNQFIFHYTYGNHQRHTIQAMFVSESFVGLDVEAKLAVSFSTTVYSKSMRQLNSVQQTLICKNNQLRLSSSKDEQQIGLASSSSSIVNPFSSTVSSINLTDHELMSILNDTISITDEYESDNTNEVISVKSEVNIASDISSDKVPSIPSEASQVDNGSQYESSSYIYSTQEGQRDRRNYFPTRVLPSQEYTASPYFAKKAKK
ncbi:ATP-dependent DNA helicase MER3 [Tyrophagus putrescentiae]|nr:ATP-dependent DNA helicase MER3 [Tyrophagus putrescentiae]